MVLSLVAPPLELLINQTVKLDPDAQLRLVALEGKRIKIQLQDLKWQFFIRIDDGFIVLREQSEHKPHAELSGNLSSFLNLALSEKGSDAIFKGDIHFAGDVATAQKFQSFFKQLDIDWEEQLSKYIGDIAAHQLMRSGRQLHHWLSQTLDTAKTNASEYLRYEVQATPSSLELENFYDAVADLKSDAEKLKQKVARLHQRFNSQSPASRSNQEANE